MKFILISLLLFISSQLSAQETPEKNIYSSSLNLGEMMNFGTRSIKFTRVISDSRCPKDVSCVWAGEAIVSVEVYEDGKCIEEKEITVAASNIPLDFPTGNMNYNISDLSLYPHPSINKKNSPGDYRLQMRISETILK